MDDKHIALVQRIARSIHRSIAFRVELEELVSMGVVGLLDAANRIEPDTDRFLAYARLRVHGAICDNLGEIAPLPRKAYRAVRAGQIDAEVIPTDPLYIAELIESVGPSAPDQIDAGRAAASVLALPDRMGAVLHGIYFHELTLTAAAARLDLSISRISRLRDEAIARLRAILTRSRTPGANRATKRPRRAPARPGSASAGRKRRARR